MYARRIQVTGRTTYIVSLPKEWVRLHGLGKGSLVEAKITPSGELILKPLGRKEGDGDRRTAIVDARGKKLAMIIREIVSLYVAGYDVIELVYSSEDYPVVSRAREVFNRILLGFDVLEEETGRTRFYVVLDEASIGFWEAYTRMARTATSMLETLSQALHSMDKKLASMIAERDDLVDKLYLLQSRKLTLALMGEKSLDEIGLENYAEALHLFLALKSIERIADHATIIASTIPFNPGKCSPAEIVEKEAQTLAKTATLVRKPDKNKAHRIAEESEEQRNKTRKCKQNTAGDATRAYDSIERIAGYLQDIAEAVIDIISIRAKTTKTKP